MIATALLLLCALLTGSGSAESGQLENVGLPFVIPKIWGPWTHPTVGQVWPHPQQVSTFSDYMVLRPHTFQFRVSLIRDARSINMGISNLHICITYILG